MFDLGAAAIARLAPAHASHYACPLCLRLFAWEDLELLSLEHAPPRVVGGTVLCLTCAQCNNTAGTKLEKDLERAETLLDFFAAIETRPIRARMRYGGLEQRGEVRRSDGEIQMTGVTKRNREGVADEVMATFDRHVSEGTAPTEIELTFDEPFSERHATIGWLRAAYLVAFAALGYRYVLRPAFDDLRRQIAEPDSELIRVPVWAASTERRQPFLFITNEAQDVNGLIVGFARWNVLLPHIQPDLDYVQRMATLPTVNHTSHLSGSFIPWPSKMTLHLDQPTG